MRRNKPVPAVTQNLLTEKGVKLETLRALSYNGYVYYQSDSDELRPRNKVFLDVFERKVNQTERLKNLKQRMEDERMKGYLDDGLYLESDEYHNLKEEYENELERTSSWSSLPAILSVQATKEAEGKTG